MAKKPKNPAQADSKYILDLFRDASRPLNLHEVVRELGLHKKEKEAVRHMLEGLAAEGSLVQVGKGYGLPDRMKMVAGRFQVQRSGVAFLIPDDKTRKDIFIHPKDFGGAWHGDRVMVVVTRERRGGKPEGRVAKVVSRGVSKLPVRVRRRLQAGLYSCQPVDPKVSISLVLDTDQDLDEGELVLATVGDQLDEHLWEGKVAERIGDEADPAAQEKVVKSGHGVPTVFPQAALEEAGTLPETPAPADYEGRKDLRELGLVTIDGAKARDFDDAVYVEERGKGHTLWVAIADVAHYVRPGSALDAEAYERGNSYYFPRSVEPMFPEKLSNGLCSLNPNVGRLAMVAEVDFDSEGTPGETRFYAAVIRSHARLTYMQVARALLDDNPDDIAAINGMGPHVLPMLKVAETLARKLRQQRLDRGTIDFDLPEPEIHFNIYGEAEDIKPRVRRFSHQMIEEFMIAANEAVARFLTEQDIPALYRIHPAPDPNKISSLFSLVASTELGQKVSHVLSQAPSAKGLQEILKASEDTPLEFMVARLTLRTMMQAKYDPANLGHFGLASDCYTHFTSPIRRYADLVVHRALKQTLGIQGGHEYSLKRLSTVGDAISGRERVAMDAEREILKRITILVLQDRVGEEFTGVINSLADFGFWVELNEVMAEGMVRLSSMTDDYYAFYPERQLLIGERTGRIFKLGQEVKVVLKEVNLSRLEVNLEILEGGDVDDPDFPTVLLDDDTRKDLGRKRPAKKIKGGLKKPGKRRPGKKAGLKRGKATRKR